MNFMTPISKKMKNGNGNSGDSSAGFTLIEILISIAMAGIVMAGIYSIFLSLNKIVYDPECYSRFAAGRPGGY